jgi:hypothetical protein
MDKKQEKSPTLSTPNFSAKNDFEKRSDLVEKRLDFF